MVKDFSKALKVLIREDVPYIKRPLFYKFLEELENEYKLKLDAINKANVEYRGALVSKIFKLEEEIKKGHSLQLRYADILKRQLEIICNLKGLK